MTEPDNTTARTLLRAAEIGEEAGLRYVYAGNLPGQVGEYEHTFCPNCKTRLIERYGYVILDYRITAQGTCPDCATKIAGLWTDKPETVRLDGPGRPRAVSSVVRRYRSDTP
jgi:pyruvate formate lyase activating enzyme